MKNQTDKMGSPHHDEEPTTHEPRGDGDIQSQQQPPPPPEPEKDAGIIPPIKSPVPQELDHLTPETIDIFELEPVSALRLFCCHVEALVAMTGDVPPTPPVRSRGTSPSFSHRRTPSNLGSNASNKENTPVSDSRGRDERIDGIAFQKTPMGSPEAQPNEPTTVDVGHNAQPLHIQHGALARKFYSKRPPPISVEEYLMRMHKYCPMSTAVYLAASYYITQLAIVDQIVPVTPRNAHRIVLAGLRVAMKALEDLSWPHSRFSKVGGVTEIELGRLEITFCFLMEFALKVDAAMLQKEAESLCRTAQSGRGFSSEGTGAATIQLQLPADRIRGQNANSVKSTAEKRKASSSLPMRPPVHAAAPVEMGVEIVGQS